LVLLSSEVLGQFRLHGVAIVSGVVGYLVVVVVVRLVVEEAR
jgi:hypothetical protein